MKENDLRDSYLAAVRDALAVPFADPVTIRETVVSRADARAIERAMTRRVAQSGPATGLGRTGVIRRSLDPDQTGKRPIKYIVAGQRSDAPQGRLPARSGLSEARDSREDKGADAPAPEHNS